MIGIVYIAPANIVEQLVRVQEKRIVMKIQHCLHYSNASYARKNVIISSPFMLFLVDWLSILTTSVIADHSSCVLPKDAVEDVQILSSFCGKSCQKVLYFLLPK